MKPYARWCSVLLALLMLLSACSKPPVRQVQQEAGNRPASALISIRLLGSSDPVMDAVISAFYAKYPDYRVEMVPYASGGSPIVERIKARIDQGEVDLVPVLSPRELVGAGLLMPLDPLIQKHKVDLAAIAPLLDQVRVDGKLYDLPYLAAPVVLTYNNDRFQSAGVAEPGAGWTWDQFREAALRLSEGVGEARQWGFGTVPGDPQLVSMYMGGKSGSTLRRVEEVVVGDALQFFTTLIFSDQSMPIGPPTGVSPSPIDLFSQGKSAMGLWQLGNAHALSDLSFRWDIAPVPSHPGGQATTLAYIRTLGIASTSKNPEAAFTFLRFLTGPEGALAVARAGTLPALLSPEAKRAWLDRASGLPAGAAAALEMSWIVAPRGADDSTAGKQLEALSTIVDLSLSGERTWEEALALYRREVERIRSESK